MNIDKTIRKILVDEDVNIGQLTWKRLELAIRI